MVEKRKPTPADIDRAIDANETRIMGSIEAGRQANARGDVLRSFDEPTVMEPKAEIRLPKKA